MSDLVVLDIDAARRLTERIRRVAQNVAEQVEDLRALVAEAKRTDAHLALCYPSWTAYIADLFGDEPLRLARDVRRELVAELHNQGMSTRAIAPIVGVTRQMVSRDLKVATPLPPEPSSPSWDLPAWAGGTGDRTATHEEVTSAAADVAERREELLGRLDDAPKPITGLDGKTYPTPPAPATPRRRALTDQARDAGWELRKAADRLTRIQEDDRFSRNKEEVASHLRGHLQHAVQVCQDLLNGFDQPRED